MKRGDKRGGGRSRAHAQKKQQKRKERAERIRRARAEGGARGAGASEAADFETAPRRLGDHYLAELVLRRMARRLDDVPLDMTPEMERYAIAELAGGMDLLPAGDDRERAQEHAFFALEAIENDRDADADRYSRAALRLDRESSDALLVRTLLETSDAPESARRFERVVRLAERQLGPEVFERDRGRFWLSIRTRPFLRALQLFSDSAWHAGRHEESFAGSKRILELAAGDVLHVRVPLLARYIARGRLDDARTLLDARREDRSAGARWCRVLLHVASGKRAQAKKALEQARRANPHVERHLRGERGITPLPSAWEPGGLDEAAYLALHLVPAWMAVAGATEWLRSMPSAAQAGRRVQVTDADLTELRDGWYFVECVEWFRDASQRYLAQIALHGSALAPGAWADIELVCRRRPDNRPCRTRLRARRTGAGDEIEWQCPHCLDSGFCRAWERTFVGEVRAQQSGAARPGTLLLQLTENERELLFLQPDLYARTWALLAIARRADQRFELRCEAPDLEAILGCVADLQVKSPASFVPALEARIRGLLGRRGAASEAERGDSLLLHRAAGTYDPCGPRSSPRLLLRAELVGIFPPIWRELTLPLHTRLDQLHTLLQLAFGWTDSHLHLFLVQGERYGDTARFVDGPPREERRTRLADLGLAVGASFTYVYDFGDDWTHRLSVLAIEDEAPLSIALEGGARPAPPEDCGGIPGMQALALANDPRIAPEALDLARRAELVAALAFRFWSSGRDEPDAE